MPTKRWIDKKAATTFNLVHRPQNDPKIHDASASSMVFKEVAAPNKKIKTKHDLEDELGLDPTSLRENEGEAALHGIYYDDTDYDYMQHLRDVGSGTEAYFVEAVQAGSKQKNKGKGKDKQSLEDALRDASLEDERIADDNGGQSTVSKPLLDEDILPSKNLKKSTYQDQQDIPDTLAGFQPDMDPRLREVLEALEDEAYVDDEEEIFGELAKDGHEVSMHEFEELGFEDDQGEMDDGWETDDTTRPGESRKRSRKPAQSLDQGASTSDHHPENAWMTEYSKFKNAEKAKKDVSSKALQPSSRQENPGSRAPAQSIISGTGTSFTAGGSRRKKRKGAMTSSSGYSMTSSSLFRTEGLTLLDDRFEKIEEEYASRGDDLPDDDDDMQSLAPSTSSRFSTSSRLSTTSSQATGPIREDFEHMLDDFLGNYSMSGKRRVKRGGQQSGLEQLDEIRKGLGPAVLKRPAATTKT